MRTLSTGAIALVLSATVATAQHAPSQFELNGFLLGQHLSTIETALGRPWRVDTARDGWTDRIYVIDRERNAYMVFKYDTQRPNYNLSIQLAGAPGTTMRPFLGLRLGARRADVVRILGRPTDEVLEDENRIMLLRYADRNYSVELDSLGQLSSIMVFGYNGLSQSPSPSEPDPLTRLRRAFASGILDSLIVLIAPDVEVFQDSGILTFRRAPRTDFESATSPLARALLGPAPSLRHAVKSGTRFESAVRVADDLVGLVYTSDTGPIREIVFKWLPGGYRLWEVRFR